MTITGHFYAYGIIWRTAAAGGANAAQIALQNTTGNVGMYESCAFELLGTSSTTLILGNANSYTYFRNCTYKVGAAGTVIQPRGRHWWTNTASFIQGATIPTNLFSAGAGGIVTLEGVDISALSAKTIMITNGTSMGTLLLDRCKLPASITAMGSQNLGVSGPILDMVRCSNGSGQHITERHYFAGDLTTETTIVRSGGASDGVQSVAWKVITTANSSFHQPFVCPPITLWNASTSSITITVYGIWGSGSVPKTDEIWMDVVYPGSASDPQGSFSIGAKADVLATGGNQSSDSSTWGGSTTAFKMTATFTPAQVGPLTIWVKCAKTATTFYIDPKPAISGVTVSKSFTLPPGVYANELSTAGGGFAQLISSEGLIG
jgi:hypothetical protein